MLARQQEYSISQGPLISLKNNPKSIVQFKRVSISIGQKLYQIDLRELVDDLKTDAQCRDFTMNAIYLDLKQGYIIDILGGVVDIQRKIIRGCASPEIVFKDKARILRLFRFEQTLGFTADPTLLSEARLSKIDNCDRKHGVINEFCKILNKRSNRSNILLRLIEWGVMPMILESFFVGQFTMRTELFERDCKRLIEWMDRNENFLAKLQCPIYRFHITPEITFKLLVVFFILSSIPRPKKVDGYKIAATTIVKRVFAQSPNEKWSIKALLLMMYCTREDTRVSMEAFNAHITSQLPLPVTISMNICFNLNQNASKIVNLANTAYNNIHKAK